MISRRTFFVVLITLIVVDTIQCGFVDDIAQAVHFDDIKKFTENAAKKTGQAATDAFKNVKTFLTPHADDATQAGRVITKGST